MILYTARIPDGGRRYEGEDPPDILELDNDEELFANGPVKYNLYVDIVSERLIINGRLETKLKIECARCSNFFSTSVSDSSFLRDYPMTGDMSVLDLGPDMREALILQIPHFPLCSETCKGLCPQCGQNLNKQSCACGRQGSRLAWDTLDNLELDD